MDCNTPPAFSLAPDMPSWIRLFFSSLVTSAATLSNARWQALSNLRIPKKLDAFVLNPDACGGINLDAKIATISQPNNALLRFKDYVLEGDILDPVDIHNASPAGKTSRVNDLGSGELRGHRLGVYLHWILPRCYRTGVADEAKEPPQPPGKNHARIKPDSTAPKFGEPLNRWLVIWQIDKKAATTQPARAPDDRFTDWVVESDRVWSIQQIDEDIDLQVDVSPYIMSNLNYTSNDLDNKIGPSHINLGQEAETFIGYRAVYTGTISTRWNTW